MLRKLSIPAVTLLPLTAFAQSDIDTAVTAMQTDGLAAIGAVGIALVAMAASAVVFKWVKGMIFG